MECKWNSSLKKIDNHLNKYFQQEDNVFFFFWREYRRNYHCQKKREYNRAKEKEAQHVEHWFDLSIIFIEVQYSRLYFPLKKKKYSIVTLPQTSSSSTLHIPMNVWPYDVWVCLFFFFCQSHVEKVHEVQYSYGFMHVGVLFWQGCVRRTHAYVGWIVSTIAVGLRNEN